MNSLSLTLPDGYRIEHFACLDSTNTKALELARAGEPSGLWVVADQQTAARGSRGRDWVSLEGNLFASVLLRNPADFPHLSDLAFVAVLAVEAAITRCFEKSGTGKPDIELKWPNDVLVGGGKVSGILLENHKLNGDNCVITGIGVNIVGSPDNALYPATALAKHGLKVSRDGFFAELASQFDRLLELWQQGCNFGKILELWLANAKGLGKPICVETGVKNSQKFEGIFKGIDQSGALILEQTDGKLHLVHVGDVFFPG